MLQDLVKNKQLPGLLILDSADPREVA